MKLERIFPNTIEFVFSQNRMRHFRANPNLSPSRLTDLCLPFHQLNFDPKRT
jgi:hypothetical protein